MKIVKKVIMVLLILLSISSGIAKMMQLPEEMKFFQDAGFSEILVVLFGMIQLLGGGFLIFQKGRLVGAILMVITFGISTLLIFISGKFIFGFFSLLPILLLGFTLKEHLNKETGVLSE